MAQHGLGIGGGRQNQFGIAEVKQTFLAMPLEHVLGQGQVAAPGRDRCLQLAALFPRQVTHRDAGQVSQALDHQRVSRDAAPQRCQASL